MLKQRLFYGTILAFLFTAVMIFDGWLDGSLTKCSIDDRPVRATALCILIAMLQVPAQIELSKLAAAKNVKIFVPVSIAGSIVLSTFWFFQQLSDVPTHIYIFFIPGILLMVLFLYQYIFYGTESVLANCGASFFSAFYTGLLSGFCLAVYIDFGLVCMLMYVFVVKGADIGAYAIGMPFGRHKFSPKLSPGKTWEGMAGAAGAAVVIAVLFAVFFNIMILRQAVIFGLLFAFLGQLGDLAESMIKRDARKKDASNNVPGFGGILDIVDSLLVSAPFSYLFFMLVSC
jgi:phosphatidate cytidylyltransferase